MFLNVQRMINNDILEDVAVSTTGLTITDLHSTSYTRFVRNRWSGLRVSLIDFRLFRWQEKCYCGSL